MDSNIELIRKTQVTTATSSCRVPIVLSLNRKSLYLLMPLNGKHSPYAVSPELLEDLEQQWRTLSPENNKRKHSTSEKNTIGWFRWARRIMVSLGLSFIGIVSSILLFPRFCVYYYLESHGSYPSILLAAGTVLVSLFFLYVLVQYILIRKMVWSSKVNVALVGLVCGYLLYGLLFFSNANSKDASIKETYLNLHPVLRIGLTTAILADTKLIVTNTQRTKQDYKNWGLSPKEQSLHYIQAETGFVHAVDLRTIGRSELQNKLVEWGFKLMGFKTLRHVGTADHLHVSLPVIP